MLSREAILQADDLPREAVAVPEWGGELYVRTLTGTERDRLEASLQGKKDRVDLENVRARFAVLTICDEQGTRLFTHADISKLGKKSAAALDRVFAVAQRLNGFSDSDAREVSAAGN